MSTLMRLLDRQIETHYKEFLSLAKILAKKKSFDPYDLLHDTIARLYERDMNFIDDIMKRTVTIIDYKKTQTVTPVDVVQGLHGVGQKIYI